MAKRKKKVEPTSQLNADDVYSSPSGDAKMPVVGSQSSRFDFTPDGYMEAQLWLQVVGEWDNVSTKGFSTDGWSIIGAANVLWEKQIERLRVDVTEDRVWVQIGNVGVGYDKANFIRLIEQSERYQFALGLRI